MPNCVAQVSMVFNCEFPHMNIQYSYLGAPTYPFNLHNGKYDDYQISIDSIYSTSNIDLKTDRSINIHNGINTE